jgi:hypothetical protein
MHVPLASTLDIGSRFQVVAVGADRCDEPVKTFHAFTGDLVRLAVSSDI